MTSHNNSVAKQIVAKPLEHATLVYACVMVNWNLMLFTD